MTPATNKPPKSKQFANGGPPPAIEAGYDKPEGLPEAERITSVLFLHPELIAGRPSVSIALKSCLSIEPVVMAEGGRLVPPADGQSSCGLLIRREVSQDTEPRRYVARHLVPWANIGHVEFGL